MARRRSRLLLSTIAIGLVLSSIHALTLVRFRSALHEEIRRTIIGRDAAVLLPVARQQIVSLEKQKTSGELLADELVSAIVPSAQQEGMLSVTVFDSQGTTLRSLPGNLLFAELSADDYLTLLKGITISRFHPAMPLDRYFAGTTPGATAPVLEVVLPLDGRIPERPHGFAHYYIDARALGRELATIESRMHRQTLATLCIGTGLIALVLAGAYFGLRRAHRLLDERNQRLVRANLDLTLSSKISALGQLTSHLIHGLQGSVAELRAIMHTSSRDAESWISASQHTDRIQSLISEIIDLLGDAQRGAGPELNGEELCALIVTRNEGAAAARQIRLNATARLQRPVNGHTGGLLCLIATNLIENAIKASSSGEEVRIALTNTLSDIHLTVADKGPGIPDAVRSRLFEPGSSGRTNGTGLGLSISQLIARQLRGEIELLSSGPTGTVFRVRLPLDNESGTEESAHAARAQH
ncbi:MAG: sensor histidine kinase [Nibricoccus sp.]